MEQIKELMEALRGMSDDCLNGILSGKINVTAAAWAILMNRGLNWDDDITVSIPAPTRKEGIST